MTTPIISVENLSKAYRIGLKEEMPDTLVGAATGWMKAPLRNWRRLRNLNTFTEDAQSQKSTDTNQADKGELVPPDSSGSGSPALAPQPASDIIWALRDVSFDVHEGEVVGIIGRNGAGKSTLLKILSRITEPTSGRAIIRGRVSSLLEVGTGFHPELTGRENIYMNGTILGMRKKEIDRKFDEIVDFSGVEKFLDTPIKRYSSGMQVRLAFAVAAHLEPEILIIDEVLAVGDAEFQRKCLGKMQDVARGGRTVLFVSHNMGAVQALCMNAILIDKGTVIQRGGCDRVLSQYMRSRRPTCRTHLSKYRKLGMSSVIDAVDILDDSKASISTIPAGSSIHIRIHYSTNAPIPSARFGIQIYDHLGESLLFLQTYLDKGKDIDLPSEGTIECHVPAIPLIPGTYYMTVGCSSCSTQIDLLEHAVHFDVSSSDYYSSGRLPKPNKAKFLLNYNWRTEF